MARRSRRFSAKEILALIVGTALACTFVIIVAGIMYALVFVTQPVNQHPIRLDRVGNPALLVRRVVSRLGGHVVPFGLVCWWAAQV
jgi:hypothetical protein